MQSWPYLMKYHEAPNYVCEIISGSTVANLLAHLNESDLKIHYQSHLYHLPAHSTLQKHYTIWHFPREHVLSGLKPLCLVLPSSWEVLLPGVHSDLSLPWRPAQMSPPLWSFPNQPLSSSTGSFFLLFCPSTFYPPSLEWALWGGTKKPCNLSIPGS